MIGAREQRGRRSPIVMLVPHEPTIDPRVGLVGEVCRSLAPTHTISVVNDLSRPLRQFDGQDRIDRVPLSDATGLVPFALSKGIGAVNRLVDGASFTRSRQSELDDDFTRYTPVPEPEAQAREKEIGPCLRFGLKRSVQARVRFLNFAAKSWLLADAVRRAVRGIEERPSLVLCHDVYSLPAAHDLKKRFGCPVVYDCHEYWPEGDLLGEPWSKTYWSRVERRLARQADAVVTVSPPLADLLQRSYKLDRVLCVPNWVPRDESRRREPSVAPSPARLAGPTKFILQGSAAPGRGFEMLLHTWSAMAEPRAELYVRCPNWEYLQGLRERFHRPDRGIHFLDAVAEADLVQAAAFADVGVIPYPPNNTNHRFCCPNKLSQYLQAGLPVLASETAFVGDRLRAWKSGWTYDAFSGDDLASVVRRICDDRQGLERAKRAAAIAGRDHCHWDAVKGRYEDLLGDLMGWSGSMNRRIHKRAA